MLTKIIFEAVLQIEQSCLFLDMVTGEGATWNRALFKEFKIGKTKQGDVKYNGVHPCHEKIFLSFVTDFPHL